MYQDLNEANELLEDKEKECVKVGIYMSKKLYDAIKEDYKYTTIKSFSRMVTLLLEDYYWGDMLRR